MDNLTHSLVGWALAETGLKRRSRKGLAACVLAANMPDVDVFFGWVPWAPLAMHRGFTHGLVGGVLLMPPILAMLLLLLDRWQVRRNAFFKSGLPMHFGWLLAMCYLGALTHPLLDLQNTYAVQLLSPWTDQWFHADGLFIVSPWLLAMLAVGLWLSRRRAALGTRDVGKPARIAFAGVVAFIGVNVGISARAWTLTSAEGDRVFASPEPVLFWRRNMVWRQGGQVHRGTYDPLRHFSGFTGRGPSIPHNMDDVVVRRAAIATPEVRKFLAWSQMPFAEARLQGCQATVTFGDARFAGPRTFRGFNVTASVPTYARGCPGR